MENPILDFDLAEGCGGVAGRAELKALVLNKMPTDVESLSA